MSEFSTQLSSIEERRAKLQIEEEVTLQKALMSTDIDAIYKAQQVLSKKTQQVKGGSDVKSILVDPMDLNSSFGYKNKSNSVSFDVLRGMSRVHIIKSIIDTRKEQVAAFCQVQKDKYSTGFVIKKRQILPSSKPKKLTKQDEVKIEKLTDFLLFCGQKDRIWHADTFDTFTRKFINDSLSFDQATFEIVRDNGGGIHEFLATDASTYRIADSYDDDSYQGQDRVKKFGYYPSYVQVIDSVPQRDFYPWELCFGTRNPSTDIRTNGYGRSELEDMIQTVTAIMNSDTYNANFFKVGSSPKGILSYSGNINENTLQDFRRQWMAQTSGVLNMHKIPLINADKVNFIPTHVPNKDMEFSKFQEFLIKISCAIYKIDPSEIGFPMSGSSDAKPMFEGNNEARLKYSKDKGLKPLLKQYQYWINKYIIWPIDQTFEFEFQGIEDEASFADELDWDIKSMSNFMTINEIREKRGLKRIEGGDIIANAIYLQSQQSQMMQNQQQQEGADQLTDDQEEENPFLKSIDFKEYLEN